MNYLDTAVSRSRTTLSVFVAVMLTGFASYLSIPVELNPDVDVPIIVTTIIHEGISPEDAERLLSKPAELELKTLDGITQISSFSSENAATVITEFDIDFESSTALADVREAINRAKARFPQNTEEPLITEVSAAELPIVQSRHWRRRRSGKNTAAHCRRTAERDRNSPANPRGDDGR